MHPTVSLNLSQRVNSKGIKRVKKNVAILASKWPLFLAASVSKASMGR